jgi:D-3-phosphoglycerate dehydrogenase
MLKAYSVFEDLDTKACEILKDAGIQLKLSSGIERPNKEKLQELLKDYDILIIGVKEKLTEDMLCKITTKKIIATLSIGLDHIDKSFFESELITVINCNTSNVISVAEHIFALILGLNKKIIEANNIAINGGNKTNLSSRSNDISNSTIGIIGAGKISRAVIKIAKVFNMKILCNTLNPKKHQDLLKQGVEFLSLEELLRSSDIITVNIPLNQENRNLISKDKIRLMKKSATFINTSRAEIVDMEELIKYADENERFKVGLDIDAENYKELFNIKRNNIIVTPHIAGVTKEAIERMDVELTNNIKEYLNSKE